MEKVVGGEAEGKGTEQEGLSVCIHGKTSQSMQTMWQKWKKAGCATASRNVKWVHPAMIQALGSSRAHRCAAK